MEKMKPILMNTKMAAAIRMVAQAGGRGDDGNN